jgi:protein-disulfide isomerase
MEGFDCGALLSSRWSKWFNIPVSFVGLLIYALIFSFSWLVTRVSKPFVCQLGWWLLTPLVLVALGAGLWFSGLQFYLGKFCLYCLLIHSCGLVIAFIVLRNLPLRPRCTGSPDSHVGGHVLGMGQASAVAPTVGPLSQVSVTGGFDRLRLTLLGCMTCLGILLLVTGQMLSSATTFEISEIDDFTGPPPSEAGLGQPVSTSLEEPGSVSLGGTGPASSTSPAPQKTKPPQEHTPTASNASEFEEILALKPVVRPERFVKLLARVPEMNVGEQPLLGNSDARHILFEFMSYTCPICRKLHPFIDAARQRYGDQIAIIVRPVPLHKKCNKYVQKNNKIHEFSCHYTRLALAVWHAAPKTFPLFHEYMLEDEKEIPSLQDAIDYAGDLIGRDRLETELKDPEVLDLVQDSIQLLKDSGDKLPTLYFGYKKITGVPTSTDRLYRAFERTLRVKPLNDVIETSAQDLPSG